MTTNTESESSSNWRVRLLDNPALLPVMWRRLARFVLADAAAGPERRWWVSQSAGFKFNFVVFLALAAGLLLSLYLGVPQMLWGYVVNVVSRQVGQKSICGKPIKTKHAVHMLGTFVDAQAWGDYLVPPYPNITDTELARGIINIEYPNQLSLVSLDLGDVQKSMLEMSRDHTCVCAADLYIPYSVFAFHGKMYWRIDKWTSAPSGNSSCFGTALYAPDYAKGNIVGSLCSAKGEYVHFTKGVLCCMEFCAHSQGIFAAPPNA